MAIQFKCPACDAMIRVPDASAGKKGTCPQCSEKLIVPSVAQGTTATIAGPAPVPASRGTTAKAEAPHVGMPHIDVTGKRSSSQTGTGAGVVPQLDFPKVESQPEQKLPKLDFNKQASDAIPELGLPPLVDDVAPSLAQTLATKERKKKASRKMAWAGPAVCGVALLGVLAVFYWMSQPKLDGQLDGHSISGMETHPALIPGHVSGLDKAELTDVLRHLQSTPAEWDSNSSRIKLTGTDDGVSISLRPGRGYHLVAVQTAQNKALLDFVKQHADELDKPRLAAIQKHAPKLFSDWLTHFTEKTAMVNQAEHRDHVIFPSLVTGVGYHLEASVKGTRYPCVYEDGEGGIYFLLPNATKTFTMHGRSLAGGGSFPANFTVHVEGTKEAPATSKKKSQGKTKEEREAENQGMNPDLHKPKSDPNKDMSAPDSEAAALKGGLGNLLAPGSRASNTKAKTPRQTKMEMMDDADMPDDAMPGKPKSKSAMPLKGDKTKDGMMKGEMPEDDGEMMEKPKVKAKK